MWQDNEPSILEYARFYGLTVDHQQPHPLSELSRHLPAALTTDESDLPEISKNPGRIVPERLEFGKDAAIFLASIINAKKYPRSASDDFLPKTHRIRDLKLESPLLQSDHELDMQQFGCRIVPDFRCEYLPLEKINDESDEGLGWPSSYYELPIKASARSFIEKLVVSKDVLIHLRDALQQLRPGEETLRYDCKIKQYQRSRVRDPVAPPLLPMSPEVAPFVPSSNVGLLDTLSEHSSPFREELRDLDKIILERDTIGSNVVSTDRSESENIAFNSDNLGDLYSPLKGIKDPPSPPVLRRRKTADLKVDGPLTPPRSQLPPPWKSKNVSFSTALVEIIPDLPSPIPYPEKTSSEDIDRFFAEVVRPIAEQADRRIEQEQLQEVDTTMRVKVPIMDFARPIAPWKQSRTESRDPKMCDKLPQDIKYDHLSNCFWPLSGIAERALPWSPFPSNLAKVAIEEFIDDGSVLAQLISQLENIDPVTLFWKLDGLRVFDNEDSDAEDIEVGHFPETVDMKSLIRKRKMDLQEDLVDSSMAIPSKAMNDSTVKESSHINNILTDSFSVIGALDNFTNIRTGEVKRKKLDRSSYFSRTADITNAAQYLTTKTPPVIPVHKPTPRLDRAPVPIPELVIPSSPRSFIISSSLLLNRPLFRLIEKLYPTAEFIERDFTLHITPTVSATTSRHQIKTRTPTSPLIHEADILLSPSTGLLLATLPQIAQRPLPGSTGLPPIYDRILHIAPRYEFLIILVSDAPSTTTESITSPTPLLPLHGFCASLPLSTIPSILFVPTNPPPMASSSHERLLPLATYIVHLMTTHSLPSSVTSFSPTRPTALQLQQEETNWEVFLRRAGFNAFAAQAVLAALRPPVLSREWDELDAQASWISGASGCAGVMERRGWTVADGIGKESTLWGLAAFVRMGAEERGRRFEGLLGGRGVLERVGRVLDERWE